MSLEYSKLPGMYERMLQRRINNPLFKSPGITHSDLVAAQILDSKNLQDFMPEFNSLVQQIALLSGQIENEKLDDFKVSLDKLYTQCGCLPGDVQTFKQAIRKLIAVITSVVMSNSQDDPMALQKLEDENATRLIHYDLQDITVVADITHPDSPVTEDDLVAILLSETLTDLEKVLPVFSAEQLVFMHKDAEQRLIELQSQGYDLPQAWQNLDYIKTAMLNTDE